MKLKTNFYAITACVLALVGIATFFASWLSYANHIGWSVADISSAWGEFGDFIGGFAGTVIALSTLIALSVTLFLQARALDETKAALAQQTAATSKQISLLERTEALKLRPLLKAEWYQTQPNYLEWRIRNIGLGPAILDRIELFFQGEKLGEHPMEIGPQWIDAWQASIRRVLPRDPVMPGLMILATPMTYLKRALGAAEYQAMIGVGLTETKDAQLALAILNSALDVVIHFRSVAGESLSTRNQFDFSGLPTLVPS